MMVLRQRGVVRALYEVLTVVSAVAFAAMVALVALVAIVALTGCEAPWADSNDRPLWGSGTIEGTSIIVASQVGGTVDSVFAAEGERYEAGTHLLSLEAPELEIERGMRTIDRTIAATERQLLGMGARQEDIREAEARARRAERDLSAARDEYQRMSRLLDAGSVTRSRYENAELAVSRAEAEYEAAVQSLERLRNLTRPEEHAIARLREERAGRAVELAQLSIDRLLVLIPRGAWLDLLLVERGELVRPGQAVARLVDRDPVTLTVYIPQRSLGAVSVGDRADVLVDAWPDERFAGAVTRIAEEAEFTPGSVQTRDDRARLVFAVEIEIPNGADRLRPGMGAEAEFRAGGRSDS